MRQASPTRFWIELAVAIAGGVLTALTAIWPSWIERIVGYSPDGGNGDSEWALVLTLAALTLASSALSARTWLRHARQARTA